jgi:hypothetical protein
VTEEEIRADERKKLSDELHEIVKPWRITCMKWSPAGLRLLDAVMKFLIEHRESSTNPIMLKHKEKSDPNSCLNKAADLEPVFVLRANDKLAPELVEKWAADAERHGCGEAKVREARNAAEAMRAWGKEQGSKFPD